MFDPVLSLPTPYAAMVFVGVAIFGGLGIYLASYKIITPNKPSGIRLGPDERIVVESPGAGGYGVPSERDPAAIETDRRDGKFGERFVDRHYRRDRQ